MAKVRPRVAKTEQKQDQNTNQPIVEQQKQVAPGSLPNYPRWPVSKPGPRVTPPPPGMRPVNVFRPEQVVEVGATQPGENSLADDSVRTMLDVEDSNQPRTAQEEISKRKKRL